MTFITTVKIQFAYVCVAVLYNLASLISVALGNMAFTPTDPIAGIIFLLVVGAGVFLGYRKFYWAYLGFMVLTLPLIGYGGIYIHALQAFSAGFPTGYASEFSWAVAILINLIGFGFGLIGLVQAFRKRKDRS